MNRRDFLKALIASPMAFYFKKVEAGEMKLFDNKTPEISYFGRWIDGYTGFGASYIRVRFTGTKIGAVLKSPNIWWRAFIDNELERKFTANGELLLAQNLEDREHEIFLTRSSEGQAGISYFGGFLVEDNAKLITSPKKPHTLEFIGDSITAGAMNDGVYDGTNYDDVGDNNASYGPVLARMLNAEYSVIAKSGQGVAINYAENPPFTMPHAADLYNWAFFYDSFNEKNIIWNNTDFPIDATFVAYGTNDFTTPYQKPSEEDFKYNYEKIIKNIREKNGNIPIICIHIPFAKNAPFAAKYISETVMRIKNQGDKNIYYIEINEKKPLLEPSDFVDGQVHPTKEGSKKVAEFLFPRVKKILGW